MCLSVKCHAIIVMYLELNSADLNFGFFFVCYDGLFMLRQ